MQLTRAELDELMQSIEIPPAMEVFAGLREVAASCGLEWHEAGRLRYAGGREYPFVRMSSRSAAARRGWILLRAGIHGVEVAGPLTLLRHLREIAEAAHARGFGLVIYPLDNPSGYDARVRYNADGDRGSEDGGNNDYLRYVLADGTIAGDLLAGAPFERWLWASDPSLGLRLPQETMQSHADLRRLDLSAIRGCLDLHQDHFLMDADGMCRPGAYHYAFGDVSRYAAIADEIASAAPLLANRRIGSGLVPPPHMLAALSPGESPDSLVPRSDSRGFIVRHDGTLTDLLFRTGVRHAITVETTGATGLDTAIRINLIWLRGLLDLLSSEGE